MVSYSRVLFFSCKSISMTDLPQQTGQRGIPGKWFTLPFGFVLLFSVWLVISMAFRFQAIMKQLEASRDLWPRAAEEIRSFLTETSSIAGSATDESTSNQASNNPSEWQQVLSKFSNSNLFDEQSIAAREFIVMARKDATSHSSIASLLAKESLRSVAVSELKRSQLQSGIVGWCTMEGLRLKLPPIFVLD